MNQSLNSRLAAFALVFFTAFVSAAVFAVDDSSLKPTDPQIAQIVMSANRAEIEASKTAKRKSDNTEVKAFAEMMITEHTAVSKETKDLVKKLNVRPLESPTSKNIDTDVVMNAKKFREVKGAEFDKEYVDQMVSDHQSVLDTIDHALLPNVKNSEVKQLLMKVRPSVANHLNHAKSLQAKLSGASAG